MAAEEAGTVLPEPPGGPAAGESSDAAAPSPADARAGPITAPPMALAPPAPVAAMDAPLGEFADAAGPALARSEEDGVVVTGSRIPRPSLEEPSTLSVATRSTPAAQLSAKTADRGDWNACTVDDPGQTLVGCRALVDPAADGAEGRAAAHLADGLTRAWAGDLRGAIRAFDRAIAGDPRSAFALLNRGLAYRRSGDLDRALADLDRSVGLAPLSARALFQRSLLLRQMGQSARAEADLDRAIELDRRYAALRD